MSWFRIGLAVVVLACLVGVLFELRTAWRWVLGPALGLGDPPLRIASEVSFVRMKSNSAPAFRTEIGETRFRGSTGYIASATFDDEDGRLRIVHAEGLFVVPDKGRRVEVAYLPALPSSGVQEPGSPVPTEAAGALLTFDILYGRATMYAALASVAGLLIFAFGRFAARFVT